VKLIIWRVSTVVKGVNMPQRFALKLAPLVLLVNYLLPDHYCLRFVINAARTLDYHGAQIVPG
jgi:hypothetical protein